MKRRKIALRRNAHIHPGDLTENPWPKAWARMDAVAMVTKLAGAVHAVLASRFLRGESVPEIAAATGLSVSSVEKIIAASIRSFRNTLRSSE